MTADLATFEERSLVLQPISDPAGALARLREFQDFIRSVFVQGEDYGNIPGVSKPSLFKPGAEKICELYGLSASYESPRRIENWEEGFWHYEVVCTLTSRRTDLPVGQGLGSCNSKEEKYRWRREWWNGQGEPPANSGYERTYNRNTKKTSWYRNKENDARWDLPNTLLKMAKKRALVDAALSVTRSSGLFTQDVEDMSAAALGRTMEGEVTEARSQPAQRPAAPTNEANRSEGAQKEMELVLEGFEAEFGNARTQEQLKTIHEHMRGMWELFNAEEADKLRGWEKAAIEQVRKAAADVEARETATVA